MHTKSASLFISVLLASTLALGGLAGCSQQASSASSASATAVSAAASSSGTATKPLGTVDNTLASDEAALIDRYASQFQQQTYTDSETGLSVTYNLFLPANYDASQSYPMVVFIGDSTCAGSNPTRSLTQGLGAVVWASDQWQSVNPTIVCVPSYSETILDDHNGYKTTDYVSLTPRLINEVAQNYAVDTSRIYGTGQSMGCMTTLILASQNPTLYAGCMFVDGQWDASTLKGLEGQRFIYFAAEDDTNAYTGLTQVMDMFKADNVSYSEQQWDGSWSPDQLSSAAQEMSAAGTQANFVTWKTGTINASGSGMGGSVAYHMASFDYAYNCIAAMEWLFQE